MCEPGAWGMVVGVAAVAALAWVVAPWVDMVRRGTLDEQALAAMREPVIPTQRRPPDDVGSARPLRRRRARPEADRGHAPDGAQPRQASR
ncbi:hypothetical protein GCM10023201_33950 [Actinomycetospora corticicola]